MAVPSTMKAWRLHGYGAGGNPAAAVDSFRLEDIPVPEPADGQVLIEVEMTAINPVDWKMYSGGMHGLCPMHFPCTPGFEVAGIVAQVGGGVTNVAVGDEVVANLGVVETLRQDVTTGMSGTFAEYALASAFTVSKRAGLTAAETCGLPLAGTTSYQALFTGAKGESYQGTELGQLEAGQKVLILGGAATTGAIAVQAAKAIGAYVATTASANKMPDGTTKIDFLKTLGADQVIDYKTEDWSEVLAGQDYDLIYDCAGDDRDWPKASKILKKKASFVTVGNTGTSSVDYKFKGMFVRSNAEDLDKLLALMREKKLKVPIDEVFAFDRVPAALRKSMSGKVSGKITVKVKGAPRARLIFSRHGESEWNVAGKFTGWVDVDLSEKGVGEAKSAGVLVKEQGYEFDVCYTSYLKRAIKTCELALEHSDQLHVPVVKSWRLNERMYGGLTGLDKKETVVKHGAEQVQIWRRSFDLPPPEISEDSEYHPKKEAKYRLLSEAEIPKTESLKTVIERVMPFWEGTIIPDLKAGKTVFVAAHGNSIRAIVKYLENIADDVIPGLEIPTGTPLVYELDAELKPIPNDLAVAPLTAGRYLGDAEKIRAAAEAVKNQTKVG